MEKKIMEHCCTMEAKMSPEQEIRYLRRELTDARCDLSDVDDKLHRKTTQVQSLVDVILDIREYTKELEKSDKWANRRMGEYRNALHEIGYKCDDVIRDYENDDPNTVRPSKAVYNFAKTILDIVNRF